MSYRPHNINTVQKSGTNIVVVLLVALITILVVVLIGGGIYHYVKAGEKIETEKKLRMEELQKSQEDLANKNKELEKQCEKLATEASKQKAESKKMKAKAAKTAVTVHGFYSGRIKQEGGKTNIRSTPGGEIVWKIDDGSPILYIPTSGSWYYVYDLNQNYLGYVHKSKIVAY